MSGTGGTGGTTGTTRTAPAPHAPRAADSHTLAEATHLLHLEAWLLDHHRLTEWLALYTPDATYWVPLEAGQADPLQTSSIIYDDHLLMTVRVQQYADARAHARRPATRTVHQVSNVLLLDAPRGAPRGAAPAATANASAAELLVSSALTVVEYRLERQRVWGACVEHRLRRTADGLRIATKRIDLVNSEAELDGITILF